MIPGSAGESYAQRNKLQAPAALIGCLNAGGRGSCQKRQPRRSPYANYTSVLFSLSPQLSASPCVNTENFHRPGFAGLIGAR